jgi:hypothetical protein
MNPHRCAIGAILLLIPIFAFTATIHVPDDHSTIQEAVDAASDGDTVLIADGVYSGPGNMDIQWDASEKHLVIMSENGRDHCIIDCKQEGRAFFLNNGQDHRDVIDGLTITDGYGGGNAGGAILIDSTSPRIINCLLLNNTTGGDQVDVYHGGGAISVYDNACPIIQSNIIRGNFSGWGGGGISFSNGASGVVENNIIDSNETQGHGGGIGLYYNSNPLIINNLIINNFSRGHSGGGIYTYISNPAIINNTIAFNTTSIEWVPGEGGGISIEQKPFPVIKNCIIWNNISSSTSMNIKFYRQEWLDISYCNVENDLSHIFDLKPYTNIDSIPGFVDPENGNFQLVWDSPCINKGDPDSTGTHLPDFDLAGNERIFEGTVDIGAYEFNGPLAIPVISDSEDFKIYPNPSSGIFLLEKRADNSLDDLLVRIYHVGGELVLEESVDAAETVIPINISLHPDGIYLLIVLSKGQRLYQQKIIKD